MPTVVSGSVQRPSTDTDRRLRWTAWLLGVSLLAPAIGCGSGQSTPPGAAPSGGGQQRSTSAAPLGRASTPQQIAAEDLARQPLPDRLSIVDGVPDYEEFNIRGGVSDLVLTPDGTQVVLKRSQGPIYIFDAATHEQIAELDDPAAGARLTISADGKMLASHWWSEIKLWDLTERKSLGVLGTHLPSVMQMKFSPDGRWLVTTSGDPWEHSVTGTIRIWDTAQRKLWQTIEPGAGKVFGCDVSRDGKYLATANYGAPAGVAGVNSEVKVWSLPDLKLVQTMQNRVGYTLQVAFSYDSRTLAVSEFNGRYPQVSDRVSLIDTVSWQIKGQIFGTRGSIVMLAFSPDGKSLIGVDDYHKLYAWDVDTRVELATSSFLDVDFGSQISFSDDSRRFAVLCGRPVVYGHEAVRRNSPRSRGPLYTAPAVEWQSDHAIVSLAFSRDGEQLALGRRNRQVLRCNGPDSQATKFFDLKWDGGMRGFSPDLKYGVAAQNHVGVWDLDAGRQLHDFEGSPAGTGAAVFSPNGTLLASCHEDSNIKVWHLPTGKLWASAAQLDAKPTFLAFSADSRRLLSGAGHGKGLAAVWQLPDTPPTDNEPIAANDQPSDASQKLQAGGASGGGDGAKPSVAADPQLVEAYEKARALVVAKRADSPEFLATLQAVADKVPRFEPAGPSDPTEWRTAVINREGAAFGCLRFSSKLTQPADFNWVFRRPESLVSWYIISAKGTMRGFNSFKTERNLEFPEVDLPAKCELVFQDLQLGSIRPGEDYLLWFAMSTHDPVEMQIAARLIESPNQHFTAESGDIAKRIGLPLPLRYHQQPSLPLQQLLTLHHGVPVTDIAFSADDRLVATAGTDDRVRLWDCATGDLKQELRGRGVAFAPQGNLLALCGALDDPTTITVNNLTDGTVVRSLRGGHFGLVDRLAFSPDGGKLASGCRGGLVTVWDVETGKQACEPPLDCAMSDDFYRVCDCNMGPLISGAISRNGSRAAFGSRSGKLSLFSVYDERVIYLSVCKVPPLATAMSSDGSQAVFANELREIVLIPETYMPPRNLRGHGEPITAAAFSPDGRLLASASADKTLRLWEIAGRSHLRRMDRQDGEFRCVAFTPNGQSLVVGDSLGKIELREVASGTMRREWTAHQQAVNSIAVSPQGDLAVSGGDDATARIWKLDSGELQRSIPHPSKVGAVAYSSDGRYFATGDEDGVLRLMTNDGRPLRQLATSQGPIRFVGFTPDGRMLLSVGLHDQAVWIWSVARSLELSEVVHREP